MKPAELLALLQDCYRARVALILRHQAVARHVGHFDFNNTYQYVVAREETHLSWLRTAIEGSKVPCRTTPVSRRFRCRQAGRSS